jgi:hypothetical protein
VFRRHGRDGEGGHVCCGSRAFFPVRARSVTQDVRVVQAVRVRGEGCGFELGIQPETRRPLCRVRQGEGDARESTEKRAPEGQTVLGTDEPSYAAVSCHARYLSRTAFFAVGTVAEKFKASYTRVFEYTRLELVRQRGVPRSRERMMMWGGESSDVVYKKIYAISRCFSSLTWTSPRWPWRPRSRASPRPGRLPIAR